MDVSKRKANHAPIVKIDDSDRKGTIYSSAVPDVNRQRIHGTIRLGSTVPVHTMDGANWKTATGEVMFVHPRGRFFTIRREFHGPWPGAYNESFMMPRGCAV